MESSTPGSLPSILFDSAKSYATSAIWELNRAYYQAKGISAWRDDDVPYYITSNARVGKIYAEVIFGFLQDIAKNMDSDEPVYIVELGSGHGKLSFHILQALERLVSFYTNDLPNYVLVVTDIGKQNLEFFSSHPAFRSFINKGNMDVANYDAGTQDTLDLQISGKSISANQLEYPIIALGNYFFDSIPNDLFYYKEGRISNCLVELYTPEMPVDSDPSNILAQISAKYSVRDYMPLYDDPVKNEIIESYRLSMSNSFVPFPTRGIDCINQLRKLSQKGLMMVSMDKGSHTTSKLDGMNPPDMVKHGSVSFAVNYHALGTHCELNGGAAWYPQASDFEIQMVCLFYMEDSETFSNTKIAYDRFVEDFGPDDFNRYKRFIFANIDTATIQDLITILRMYAYDSAMFEILLPIFKQQLSNVTLDERNRIGQTLAKVWNCHYEIKLIDLAFEIAGIYYQLGLYEEALQFFEYSESRFGITADGYYNRILSYYQLRLDDLFAATFIKAKKKFPDYANWEYISKLDLGAV